MSFNLTRDNITLQPLKKNITISNVINPDSLKASIGSTGNSEFIILNSLSLNNNSVNATADQLNYLQVTPGTATALKALVLDNLRNINNIGTLTCTTSVTINGITITDNDDIPTGSSDDLNNPFLTNITNGIAQANKALVASNKNNITGINNLGVNRIKIKNTELKLYDSFYHLETIKKSVNSNISNIENLLSNFYQVSITSAFFQGGAWNSVCWSQELNLFVAVARSNTTANISKIMNSIDGIEWNSCTDPFASLTGYTSVCWSPELNLFIAVGSSGNNSIIVRSADGYNWISCDAEYNIILQSVCWSPELNLFIAVGSSTNTNRVLKSSDGIIWIGSNSGVYSHTWVSVCWANKLNLFVAVASTVGTENTYRIMVSNNGNDWELIKHSLFLTSTFSNIIWCEDLGMLLACNASTSAIARSYDGYNWEPCFSIETGSTKWSTITSLIWIRELQIFICAPSNQNVIYISYDGIKWREVSLSVSLNFTSMAWSPNNGLVMVNDNTGSNSNRVLINKTFANKTSLNNDYFYLNPSTNSLGVNTRNSTKPLEINDISGNCLSLSHNTWDIYSSFNVANNGILNITSVTRSSNTPLNINISTNFLSYGLKLNNVLLLPTITEYGYLSNITNGTGGASKVLVTNSSNNISNINTLSCNSLTVNGTPINDENNNNYIKNITYGNAQASKALTTNSNNNIEGINKLTTNTYNLNYDNIYGSDTSETINITKLNNKNNQISKMQSLNSIIASNWNLTTIPSIIWTDICYAPSLNLFVMVGQTGNLLTSSDGKNWTSINVGITLNFIRVCWSPLLRRFVAISNSGSAFSVHISDNGFQWYNSTLTLDSASVSTIIWVNELRMFIIVTSLGGSARCWLSSNGINWYRGGLNTSNTWHSVCWANKLGLLIACANDIPLIATSPDGIIWTYTRVDLSSNGYNTIAWSQELNMVVAVGTSNITYSYNGINWYPYVGSSTITHLIWAPQLNVFIGAGNSSNFIYSADGLNWSSIAVPSAHIWNRIIWVNELSMLITTSSNATQRVAYLILQGITNNRANLFGHKSQIFFNKSNGNLGLGTINPNYQLELSTDSAAKPNTGTWTVASDSRLKENIEDADLNICYNIIKSLKLKRYKWKDDIFNEFQIKDRVKLGWIADEVEVLLPKAVEIKNAFGLSDCKILDIEQIIASAYGCTQKLINEYELMDNNINNINTKLNIIQDFINKLE